MFSHNSNIIFNDEKTMKYIFNVMTPYVEFATELKALNFKSTVLVVHIPLCKTVESHPDYSPLLRAAHNIGNALKSSQGFKVVLLHYVSQPGSVEELIVPIMERVSKKTIGVDFGVAFNAYQTSDTRLDTRNIIGVSDICTKSCLKAMLPIGANETDFVDLSTAELIPYWHLSQSHTREVLEVEMRRLCNKRGADFDKLLSLTGGKTVSKNSGSALSREDVDLKMHQKTNEANLEALKTLLRLVQDTDTPCPMIESLRFHR